MSTIIRVFPRKTKATPTDAMAFVGDPPLPEFQPQADEVHVSVTFTWDLREGERLAEAWESHYPGRVRLGGPACGDTGNGFTPGMYLRPGYTITSRGCPNRCPWCVVPEREGALRELKPVARGFNILDNNLLATSAEHRADVADMLNRQGVSALLTGGIDADLLTPSAVDWLRSFRVRRLFLAYDRPSEAPCVEQAIRRLRDAGMARDTVHCYVLAGFVDGDTVDAAESRCQQVWEWGGIAFMMLYEDPRGRDRSQWPIEWKRAQRKWARPAAVRGQLKRAGVVV